MNIGQDGNGFINRGELSCVLQNLGMPLDGDEIQVTWDTDSWVLVKWVLVTQSQAMIDEVDADGDGQINYEEFYNMMKSA